MVNYFKTWTEIFQNLSNLSFDENGNLLVVGAFSPDGMHPMGPWDASGGTYPTPTAVGDFWWISVAGTIGGVDYEPHDWIVYVDDSGVPADDWKKIDNSDLVTSVFGRTGAVIAAISDYDASQIDNDSLVSGATVKDALEILLGIPTEQNQAIGYYVSSVRGTTQALGADGSLFNPFDDIPEAIAKGIANGDADIIVFIDTRAGTNYPNIVLPDGEHINLIGSEPLWSDGSSISLITNGNGGNLNLDGLNISQIREGAISGGVIRLEECAVGYIKDNAGTGFASNTDGYFNNTQFTIQSLITDINGMKSQHGTLINSGPGFYSFIVLDGLDCNTNKIINMVDPTADQDAATKKYVDDNGQGTFAEQPNVYFVSDLKGSDTNDGSIFRPLKTPLKAIQLGVVAGFGEIFIKMDMSGGTYSAFTIPDGSNSISISSWGGLFSAVVKIGDITIGDGTALALNDLSVAKIKEGAGWTTENADLNIENCLVDGIKKSDGTTPATLISVVTVGALDGATLDVDLKTMGGNWLGTILTGSNILSCSNGFDANSDKIIKLADGTASDDAMAYGQKYTDAEAITAAQNDPDAIHVDVSGELSTITPKATPDNSDIFLFEDSGSSYAKKIMSWLHIKNNMKTYMDTLYALITHASTHSDGGADEITVENLATAGTLKQVLSSDGDGSVSMLTRYSPFVMPVWDTYGGSLGNGTNFMVIGGDAAITATESRAQVRMLKGKIKGISGNISSIGSSIVMTVRKNGVATLLTGTVTSTGRFHITSGGPIDFADGDLVSIEYTVSGGTTTVRGVALEIETELV